MLQWHSVSEDKYVWDFLEPQQQNMKQNTLTDNINVFDKNFYSFVHKSYWKYNTFYVHLLSKFMHNNDRGSTGKKIYFLYVNSISRREK